MKPLSAISALIAALALTGCAPQRGDQDTCRTTARSVFAQVMQDKITQAEGQTKVDLACAGIAAVDMKAILDAERLKVLTDPSSS